MKLFLAKAVESPQQEKIGKNTCKTLLIVLGVIIYPTKIEEMKMLDFLKKKKIYITF